MVTAAQPVGRFGTRGCLLRSEHQAPDVCDGRVDQRGHSVQPFAQLDGSSNRYAEKAAERGVDLQRRACHPTGF